MILPAEPLVELEHQVVLPLIGLFTQNRQALK